MQQCNVDELSITNYVMSLADVGLNELVFEWLRLFYKHFVIIQFLDA